MTDNSKTDEFSNVEPGFQIFTSDDKKINTPAGFDETLKFYDYELIRWYTGTEYTIELPPDFEQQAQVRIWCLANCRGPVAYRLGWHRPDSLYFFFEEDAVAFKLRWI